MSQVMQASAQMELSPPATALLSPSMSGKAAVQALVDAGLDLEALKLLARLLPKRYAVAWLCQCARGQALDHEDRAGASLAENWVRDPSEANRRAAFDFATIGGYRSCGTWIAASAGWAAGSLAPAGQSVAVPPPDDLTAKATVAAANLLAALKQDQFQQRRRGFIDHAMNLLSTGDSHGA